MSLRRTVLHDPYLVGNGAWCSTCFPAGGPDTGGSFGNATRWSKGVRPGCNECAGHGRVAFTADQVVAATRAGATGLINSRETAE